MTSINPKLLKDFLNELYPIGKTEIFLDNEDHSNYMGFTWQRDAVGRAIVGIDSNDTDFDTIGKTGGSKTNHHEHWLPFMADTMNGNISKIQWNKNYGYEKREDTSPNSNSLNNTPSATSFTGYQYATSGETIDIVQPYKVFAIWVRIA